MTTPQTPNVTTVERTNAAAIAVQAYLDGQIALAESGGPASDVIAAVMTADGSLFLRRSDLQVILDAHAKVHANSLRRLAREVPLNDSDSMPPELLVHDRDRVRWQKNYSRWPDGRLLPGDGAPMSASANPAADSAPLVIDSFRGEFVDLSNFPLRPVAYRGRMYPSKEHAFAAAKTTDPAERMRIAQAPTAATAKSLGRAVTLRPDWDELVRFGAMQEVLADDFDRRRSPHNMLLGTGDALLIDGNTWHDVTWGRCSCAKHAADPGLNHLGRELMALRGRLRGDVDRWHRVAVTGHREMTSEQTAWVAAELPRVLAKLAAEHGTRKIIDGMAIGADTLAGEAALAAGLDLWAYIPYPQQASKFTPKEQDAYAALRLRAEREVILAQDCAVRHLHNRNRLMMLDSNAMIAIYDPTRTAGGAVTTMARAHADGWPIISMDLSTQTVSLLRGDKRPWN